MKPEGPGFFDGKKFPFCSIEVTLIARIISPNYKNLQIMYDTASSQNFSVRKRDLDRVVSTKIGFLFIPNVVYPKMLRKMSCCRAKEKFRKKSFFSLSFSQRHYIHKGLLFGPFVYIE